MNINVHWPGTPHPLAGLPGPATGPAVAPYEDPDLKIVHAFELAATGYLIAVLGPVLFALGGALPVESMQGWAETYFMTACLPLALSVVAAALYGLPHALGARLWSPRLGWTHFVLLNSAIVVPAWRLLGEPGPVEIGGARLVALVVVLQTLGLASMLANLLETVARLRPPVGPR